ncbi:MAG: hypothetical protein ABR521_02545 [Gaiellaceae bacterium]
MDVDDRLDGGISLTGRSSIVTLLRRLRLDAGRRRTRVDCRPALARTAPRLVSPFDDAALDEPRRADRLPSDGIAARRGHALRQRL